MFETKMVTDTLQHAVQAVAEVAEHSGGSEQGEGFSFMHLLDHIKDARVVETPLGHIPLPQFPLVHIGGITVDLSMTKHVFFLLLSAVLLVFASVYAARSYKKTLIPHGFVNSLELLIIFVRDEIALPNMGPAGLRYMPYLLTTFFYILIMNLAGLVPYGSTATGNIMVTAGLAAVAFVMIQLAAIRAQGVKHYIAHLTGGSPWFLWIIMVPIEILGLFTKPFALCMRLFANMTGGHIVILSFFGLAMMFRSYIVAPAPILFIVGISMLEIFVAFLQAYVFTMLTCLFMGLGMPAEHHEEEHSHEY